MSENRTWSDTKQGAGRWRSILSRMMWLPILVFFAWWSWQNRIELGRALSQLGITTWISLTALLTLCVLISAWSFTVLVRSMGYRFSHLDGYHSLNLSQVAAMVPGKVWGFVGLAGLLWSRNISKPDSVLIIFLHTMLMLSAAVLVGLMGLISTVGWAYALLCLTPVIILLVGRPWLDKMRQRFFAGSSCLPSQSSLFTSFVLSTLNWILASLSFAVLVYVSLGYWPTSPAVIGSAFAAGYVGGYVALIAPLGLGVREGIMTLILRPFMGSDQAMSLALIFRVIHTAVLWLHVAITLLMLACCPKGRQKE